MQHPPPQNMYQQPPGGIPQPAMIPQPPMAGQSIQYRKRPSEADSLAKHIKYGLSLVILQRIHSNAS